MSVDEAKLLRVENAALRAELTREKAAREEAGKRIGVLANERDYFKASYARKLDDEKAALETASSLIAERDAAVKRAEEAGDLLRDCDDALARMQGHGCPPTAEHVASLRTSISRAALAPAPPEGK